MLSLSSSTTVNNQGEKICCCCCCWLQPEKKKRKNTWPLCNVHTLCVWQLSEVFCFIHRKKEDLDRSIDRFQFFHFIKCLLLLLLSPYFTQQQRYSSFVIENGKYYSIQTIQIVFDMTRTTISTLSRLFSIFIHSFIHLKWLITIYIMPSNFYFHNSIVIICNFIRRGFSFSGFEMIESVWLLIIANVFFLFGSMIFINKRLWSWPYDFFVCL